MTFKQWAQAARLDSSFQSLGRKPFNHWRNRCHASGIRCGSPVLQMHTGTWVPPTELRPKSLTDLLYQSRLRPQNGAHNRCNWMHNLQKMPFCKAPRTNSNNLGSKAVWEQDHILATENLIWNNSKHSRIADLTRHPVPLWCYRWPLWHPIQHEHHDHSDAKGWREPKRRGKYGGVRRTESCKKAVASVQE